MMVGVPVFRDTVSWRPDSHNPILVKVKTQVDIIRPPGMRKIVIIELYQVILRPITVTCDQPKNLIETESVMSLR